MNGGKTVNPPAHRAGRFPAKNEEHLLALLDVRVQRALGALPVSEGEWEPSPV
jgi:hypothetical protein